MARSTDGSHRVMVPNSTSTPRPPASRPNSPSRRSSGAHSARTNATFSPDTATKMREARGAELLGDRVGDPAGVAEEEAGEQRAVDGLE